MTTCSIEGCDRPAVSRGWCSTHYSRWLRHGDPNTQLRQSPSTRDATEKFCPRCHAVKPRADFGTRPGGNPKGYCRQCEAKYQADHASSPDGREMRRKARAKWNDGNHEYFLEYRYGITSAFKDDTARLLAAVEYLKNA